MPCPLCGDICECASAAGSGAGLVPVIPGIHCEPSPQPAAEALSPGGDNESASEDSATWRQEVAARLNRYQSRRKPRPPRYPSLRLRFEENDVTRLQAESPAFPQVVVSNQALALDGFAADVMAEPRTLPEAQTAYDTASQGGEEAPSHTTPALAPARATAPATAKIIEFPRSWTPPLPALDELAEPIINRDRPRILEAPEIVPPPPALGGITIEPVQRPELEKRPGIDIPLQSAPLERRMLSALIDNLIIATACALFGFIFWKLTAIRPPRFQIAVGLAIVAFVLWAAYQYLLMVYAGTTPGLRLAGLELLRFDERRASRRLRRWRVLASYLSAVSLGMGYVWVFLDEDALCWHDRITHTYLAPKRPQPPAAKDIAS
jgi:uncharacterized RDD family membrane protein YckC